MNPNNTMDSLESKFNNMSLTKRIYLYFNFYENDNEELDVSNYKKESITIVNGDLKELNLIKDINKFIKFFKKYNIYLILNINEKSKCIIIDYLKNNKTKKTNKKKLSYNHFFKTIEDKKNEKKIN
jgi:hypothetical protein